MVGQSSPRRRSARKYLAARRDRLLAMRSDGVIGDEAFHRLEEELDFADLAVARELSASAHRLGRSRSLPGREVR